MSEPRQIVARGGVEIAARVDGSGPAMLIHNGLVSNAVHWRYWLPHYRDRFQVATWDYPGHGDSPAPPNLSSVNIEAFADQGHAVARGVFGTQAIVCGLSMGVQTALEHYRRHPGDVRALVLLCGTYGHPLNRVTRAPAFRDSIARALRLAGRHSRVVRAALWPATRTPIGREMAYLTGGAHRSACPPAILDELFRHVAGMRPDVMTEAMASYLLHDASEVLESIRVPTLIVAGDRDELTPPSLAEEMHDRIRDSSLHIVRGHSHLAQLEVPGEVHGVVDDFLARHELDRPPL